MGKKGQSILLLGQEFNSDTIDRRSVFIFNLYIFLVQNTVQL